jgi:hypothetical protein
VRRGRVDAPADDVITEWHKRVRDRSQLTHDPLECWSGSQQLYQPRQLREREAQRHDIARCRTTDAEPATDAGDVLDTLKVVRQLVRESAIVEQRGDASLTLVDLPQIDTRVLRSSRLPIGVRRPP